MSYKFGVSIGGGMLIMSSGAFVASGGEFLINTTVAGLQTEAAVTALAGGGFVMTWTDSSASGADVSGASIRAQLYDASGARVGGEFLVNVTTANPQTQPVVTALANGGFVASWSDASLLGGDADGLSVKARIFGATGTPLSGELLVNSTTKLNQSNPTIAGLANGGFVVSWTDASGIGDTRGTGVKAQIYTASGVRSGGEFLVNSTTINSQNYPVLAGLAGGGFVASWMDSSGQGGDPTAPSVKAQLFSATGTKVGAEFLVNTSVAGSQDQPVVTSLASGGFVVAWRDTSLQGDTSAAGVKAQIYNAAGLRLGGEIQVNVTTLNTQDQPAIAGLPDGGFVVTWHDNSLLASDPSGFGIRSQIFDGLGNRLGSEWVVNSSTAGNQEQPTVAALTSGAIVIGWTDFSGTGGDVDGGIKARLYVPTVGTITSLSLSAAQVSEAAVENVAIGALQASGALNAAYTYSLIDDSTNGAFEIAGSNLMVRDSLLLDYENATAATLTIRASDGFGNSFDQVYTLAIADAAVEHRFAGGAEQLANSQTASNQQQGAIAALQSGNYIVTWIDGSTVGGDPSGYGIKAQIVDAGGTRVGGEFLVNTQTLNSQDNPSVAALVSGGFVVTWADASAIGADTSGSGVKAQLFDANGSPVGGEFLVNQTTLNAQKAPAVAALSSGGFVVTWADLSLQGGDTSGSSVKARLYDSAGNAVGSEYLVNTNTLSAQDTPVIAALASGGFVVSWHDSSGIGGDSSKDAIKAQLFDAVGAPVGVEFLVNTQTQSNQQQETIAALADGGFVIAWADASNRGGDPDNYGIKAQIFDASGGKVGGELLANSTTQGVQIAPALAMLANGDFVLSWSDYSGVGPESGTPGIKAQIFTQDGLRVGGEYIVDTTTVGSQTDAAVAAAADGGFAMIWTDASGQDGDNSGTSVKLKTFTTRPDQGGAPPVIAGTDTLFAVEDETLIIDPATLLANDISATGLPLTVTSVSAVSGGLVEMQADGSIAFTPPANFNGGALFSYVASDGTDSATGRVAITVVGVNDAPVAQDDSVSISQNGGTIALSTLLANDSDPDFGDHLTLNDFSALTTLGATLTRNQGNLVLDPGTIFQALAAGQTASDSFLYSVVDSAGVTASASVTVTVSGVNDAPVGLALSAARVDENAASGTIIGTLTASDVDQGDTLAFALTDNAGGRFAVDPLTGVVSVANGALLDFESQPSLTITARATDGGGLFASSAFTIALNNLPEPKSWTGDNGINIFAAPTNDLWTINGLGGADTLTGNASADTILGGAGADVLDGAGGADSLVGGVGDDVYYVDTAADRVVENAGEGTDTVVATADFELSANIEKLTQAGNGPIAGKGNDLANTITGNAGNNQLSGGNGGDLLIGNDGDDMLLGEAGSDSLQGGNGNDVLAGGAGFDQLTGGLGQDRFLFDTLTVASEFDTIKDFAIADDIVALSSTAFTALAGLAGGALPASGFRSGTQAATIDQHVIYNPSTGNLFYDADGSGSTAMVQIAFFSTKPALTAASFVVT